MTKVFWSDAAAADVESLVFRLSASGTYSQQGLDRLIGRIEATAASLRRLPKRGPEGPLPGCRRLLVLGTEYLIYYSLNEAADEVEIIGIVYGPLVR